MEILKSRGTFKLIKIKDNTYEIKDGEDLVKHMEGAYTKEALEEQFKNVTKSCIII